MFELRHLRYFLAVAEELSFSRAAERLHVAQPALSARIRTLESQLGCALFTRTTRSVELTPHGRLLLEDARKIVAQADEAYAKLRAAGRDESGVLRLGYAAHGAAEIGTAILNRFAAVAPAVTVELVSASTLAGLQRHVCERTTDLAFVWLPLLHDELVSETVASERKLVAMHPGHRLAREAEVDPEDLRDEAIVAPWDHFPPEFLSAWFDPFRADGRQPDDPQALSVDESFTFAARGLALYCVPESASRFYRRPDVVFRPISGVAPAQVALAWRADSSSAAVASFVETTRAVISEEPPQI